MTDTNGHSGNLRKWVYGVTGTAAAGLALALFTWLGRASAAEVAFEVSLRTRVPNLEADLLDVRRRLTADDVADAAEAEQRTRLIALLEEERAAREKARKRGR